MAKIPNFETGQPHSDPGFRDTLDALVTRLNKLEGLTGDDEFIEVKDGPRGRTVRLDIEAVRRRIGKGIVMYANAQQYSSEATDVAWKETTTLGIAEVNVKRCDEDGADEYGDAFIVHCYHSLSADPNIKAGLVVPYVYALESNRLITLHDYEDGKIGDVKIWTEDNGSTPKLAANIPFGWVQCDGAGDAFSTPKNLKGKVVVGHDNGGAPDADFDGMGDTGGSKTHGQDLTPGGTVLAENVHDDVLTVTAGSSLQPFMALAFIQRVY